MRQLTFTLIGLGLLVGIALWIYRSHLAPPAPVSVVVKEVEGNASRVLSDGTVHAMRVGEVVGSGGRISTGLDGIITLNLGGEDTVVLEQNSDLVVQDISESSISFELTQGAVSAKVVRFQDRKVEVGVKGNKIRLRTQEGVTRVTTDGAGAASFGVTSGVASLVQADGTESVLPPGEQRIIDGSGEVLRQGPLASSLLLEVDWPEATTTRETSVTVSGRTEPGVELRYKGTRVPVQRSGAFELEVPLQEGSNRVKVEARGLAGSASAESPELLRDSSAPAVRTRTDDIWK